MINLLLVPAKFIRLKKVYFRIVVYCVVVLSISYSPLTSQTNSGSKTPTQQAIDTGKPMIQIKGSLVSNMNKNFSGTFVSEPVENVFRAIAKITGKSIIVSQLIQQTITANFNDEPVKDVFQAILTAKNLYYVEKGNIINILTYQEYQNELRRNYLTTRTYDASIIDINNLGVMLKPLLTPEIGSFSIDPLSSKIMVIDVGDNFERIDKLFSDLSELPPMVEIETKIINITLDNDEDYGVNWSAINIGRTAADIAIANLNVVPALASQNIAMTMNAHYLDPNSRITLDGFITALEEKRKLKLISSPKVLALNRGQARIHIGNSVPYTKTINQSLGFMNAEIAFLDTGVNLLVSALITPSGEVRLTITANVSTYTSSTISTSSNSSQQAPLLATSEVTAETVAKDGQIIIIGGLISTSDKSVVDGVPFLSGLPFIGWLFSHTSVITEREEMVIFFTPHIYRKGQSNIALGNNSQEMISEVYQNAQLITTTNTNSLTSQKDSQLKTGTNR